MKVRLCESPFHLTCGGDYTFGENRAEGVRTFTILCPSCLSACRSRAGVIREKPLTLTDCVVCAHCFAEFFVNEGDLEVKTGTLPPWVRYEANTIYDESLYR